jgi:hypothetical protein
MRLSQNPFFRWGSIIVLASIVLVVLFFVAIAIGSRVDYGIQEMVSIASEYYIEAR